MFGKFLRICKKEYGIYDNKVWRFEGWNSSKYLKLVDVYRVDQTVKGMYVFVRN